MTPLSERADLLLAWLRVLPSRTFTLGDLYRPHPLHPYPPGTRRLLLDTLAELGAAGHVAADGSRFHLLEIP